MTKLDPTLLFRGNAYLIDHFVDVTEMILLGVAP